MSGQSLKAQPQRSKRALFTDRVVNLLDPGVTCTATEGKHMQDATWTSPKMSGGHPVPRLCDVRVGARWLCSWFLERQDHCDSENPDSPSSTTRSNDVKGKASIGKNSLTLSDRSQKVQPQRYKRAMTQKVSAPPCGMVVVLLD
jgi:hypothetical protein